MWKDHIQKKNLVKPTILQKEIMTTGESPFLVQQLYGYQTKYKIIAAMPFNGGGDMHFQIKQHGKFSEELAKFYVVQCCLGIDHLHS